jgi:ATPase subunit of ABC transporter with duplicated ATPase domains
MGGFGASFLDSYMKAFQTGMERKRMETEQQQFKDRLQWEQAKQAQEFGLRQQEAAQQQAYQNAMLGIQQKQLDEATLNRQQQALEKFGEKGEGICCCPCKTRENLVMINLANLSSPMFHDGVFKRYLPLSLP